MPRGALTRTERGIDVCAPVHDALLVEAAEPDIDAVVASTAGAVAEAARGVFGDVEIGTEAVVVRRADRYADPRGATMWASRSPGGVWGSRGDRGVGNHVIP